MSLLLLAAACGTTPAAGSESSSGEPTPIRSTTTTDSTSSTTDSPPAGSSSTADVDESVGDGFLIAPDGGGISIECSTFAQNCPRGEKCNAWANDGGSAWNATKCVPLDPDPAEVGEPCTVTGVGVSGLDSCALGSMCWDVDSETDQGYCVPFCSGSDGARLCSDPNRECNITGNGVLTLCFLNCDPLEPVPCPQGQGCYPADNRFVCAPDDSAEGGGPFEACEFINACDPGSTCRGADLVGLCDAVAAGCCSPYCDTTGPTCPDGTQCVAYFEEGTTPPGYKDVGVCGQDP